LVQAATIATATKMSVHIQGPTPSFPLTEPSDAGSAMRAVSSSTVDASPAATSAPATPAASPAVVSGTRT